MNDLNGDCCLVTNENNNEKYLLSEGDLLGCIEATENTSYINSNYNCNKCSFMYILYYSKYFERNICQNIKEPIIRENEISYEIFNQVKDKVKTVNGICEKNYLFTPDNEYCYKCDDELVGMPGCKGGCSFSLKRNKTLKCEGECKSGYIESSEGICSSCYSINKGCQECHYENDYPLNYKGIKRKRRFVCDFCEEGYIKSNLGKCLDCSNFGLKNCYKCETGYNNNYLCAKCEENFFINEEGKCETCDESHFKAEYENRCINCSDVSEGGIENCLFCDSEGEKVVCKLCLPGYILLTNNNSCLEIFNNKDLQYFYNCEQLTIENNELICSKCKKEYSLVEKDNSKKCLYIPTLYDYNFEKNYQNYTQSQNKENIIYIDYKLYKKNDYYYNRYKDYYPCQEAINLSTEDNPLYSCKKCYEYLGRKKYYISPVKITEENSKLNFCINPENYAELKDCTEATYKIKNGEGIYNCTQCKKNYILTLNKYRNTYYCQSSNSTTKCIVLYCKTCNPHNGYICNECITNYEINSLTGSCIKKTDLIPAVTWKDIYRLKMNSEKMINNKYIYGPSLIMRGITSSQINTRHAFLIYLTFKIKHRHRNLQEELLLKIPAICEVLKGVDETSDDILMVEYECIGNQTNEKDLTNYNLDNIEEGNNENLLTTSNLNELISEIKTGLGDLNKLENIQEPSFTFEDLMQIIIFKMNEKIENIKANNYKFNFKIEGKLNKEITQKEIIIKNEFELNEINNKADCVFRIGSNKNADLSCNLNVEEHKDIKTFSFKTSKITADSNEIYLTKLNNIVLINSEEKDENKNTIIIIVVCSVVAFALLLGIGIFFLKRKLGKRKRKINKIDEKDASNKKIISLKNMADIEGISEERIYKLEKK